MTPTVVSALLAFVAALFQSHASLCPEHLGCDTKSRSINEPSIARDDDTGADLPVYRCYEFSRPTPANEGCARCQGVRRVSWSYPTRIQAGVG
jgi:hypothetical protein